MAIDLGAPDAITEPARYFASVRAEGGDVQWSEAQRGWTLLSHAEVEAAFRDGERLSSDRVGPLERAAQGKGEAFARVVQLLSGWMNFRDPPVHTRLREPVKAAFTPRAVAALEPEIQAIVDAALDALEGEVVDLGHDFARPVPALVIAAMLGVDPADRHRLQAWSDDLSKIVFAISPGAAPEERVTAATAEFSAFFSKLIERERAAPSGSLLSAVVAAGDGVLTPMELVGACTLLLFGGHETTTTALGNAIALLLARPELREWMRTNPERDEAAVDEFLRVGGPGRTMVRKVKVAHERGGLQFEPGQNVFLSIASANHDAAVFTEPWVVDLARTPNPHLTFGWGLHYCLGAALARMELCIALRTLLERYPALRPEGEVPPARGSALGFGRRPLKARLRG
jgi:cytochrome P450